MSRLKVSLCSIVVIALSCVYITSKVTSGPQQAEPPPRLPSSYAPNDEVQYFVPGSEKLAREAAVMKAYKAEHERENDRIIDEAVAAMVAAPTFKENMRIFYRFERDYPGLDSDRLKRELWDYSSLGDQAIREIVAEEGE